MPELTGEMLPGLPENLVKANEQLVLAILQATADAEESALRLSEVTRSAHLDALTGLPDRLLFFDRFAQALAMARRHGSQLALLFVDLDRFKNVNDTRGHAVGDRVLRAAADALQSTVRRADTVSRHGGDEFLILLTEVSSADGAAVIAHKLCDAIWTSPALATLGVQITASIGVCVYPDDGDDALTLIAHADSAMYRAKKSRSRVAVYSHDDEWSPSGQATEFATVIDGSASPPVPLDEDERYQRLREANERLLISALDARPMQDGTGRAHPCRALIDHMEDGAIAVDGDGKLLFCNRRFASLVDMGADDLIGSPCASLFATVAEARSFRALLKRGPVARASENFTLLDASGAEIPVNITFVDGRVHEADGATQVLSCIVTDLRSDVGDEHAPAGLAGRLRRAVVERDRSEDRLLRTLEAAGMGILNVDLASGVLGWTHGHDRIFGASASNRTRLADFLERVVPEDRALVEQAFADALASGVINVEHRVQRTDTGAVRWIRIEATALHETEKKGHLAGVVTDITERRALADQLRQARKMEAVGHLAYGIARDFNNLLLVIGDSIELLARGVAIDDRTRRPLESVRKAVLRGSRLNEQLRVFSRHQELDAEVLCLDDLIPTFVELVERAASDTIAIRACRLANAWSCRVDRNQLENAILNLAINGRDAMPDGGVLTLSIANVTADALAISMWGAKRGEYAAICVGDTGTGMPLDVSSRAFEPFFTTRAPGLRTGLGLSQVYGFVKQFGGFVSIDSEPGRGTRMTIHLPRHR